MASNSARETPVDPLLSARRRVPGRCHIHRLSSVKIILRSNSLPQPAETGMDTETQRRWGSWDVYTLGRASLVSPSMRQPCLFPRAGYTYFLLAHLSRSVKRRHHRRARFRQPRRLWGSGIRLPNIIRDEDACRRGKLPAETPSQPGTA